MLVSMKEMLKKAYENKYAVGQFNINNLEWTKAILETANNLNSPVILGVSEGAAKYMGGFKVVAAMVKALDETLGVKVPVALHLDHGTSFESCKNAIDAGFTSVMIDGSHFPIKENIRISKEVVDYASDKNISVEAEVGTVGGEEDGIIGGINYADLDECVKMVNEAKIDALAAALGSVHGPYQGEPKLGFAEMEEISNAVKSPLVLHGGSGILDHQIKKAISLGTAKINVNTEKQIAFTKATAKFLEENGTKIYDPRKVLAPGVEAIKDVVKEKINLFGSANQA